MERAVISFLLVLMIFLEYGKVKRNLFLVPENKMFTKARFWAIFGLNLVFEITIKKLFSGWFPVAA